MDYNPDTNASASRFYPTKGRIGKRMTGGANKTAILRNKINGRLKTWVRLYKKKHNQEPLAYEQMFALDHPQWLESKIAAFKSPIKIVITHGGSCVCKKCTDERPVGYDSWSDWVADERGRMAKEIEDDARIRMEREAELNSRTKIAAAKRLIMKSCPVPPSILRRYASGHVSAKTIGLAFEVTKKDLDAYCEAGSIKVQP